MHTACKLCHTIFLGNTLSICKYSAAPSLGIYKWGFNFILYSLVMLHQCSCMVRGGSASLAFQPREIAYLRHNETLVNAFRRLSQVSLTGTLWLKWGTKKETPKMHPPNPAQTSAQVQSSCPYNGWVSFPFGTQPDTEYNLHYNPYLLYHRSNTRYLHIK